MNERAFGVRLLDQIAGNLRLDIRIDQAVERADPLGIQRDVLLLNVNDLHLE